MRNDPRVQVLEGQLNLARRNLPAAAASFRRVLDQEPAAYDALYGLVQSRLAAGDVKTAVAEASAAAGRAPAEPTAQLIAARTFLAARDFDRAEQTLRQVIQSTPQHLDAYPLLGFVYAAQGRVAEAAHEFDEVVRRQPGDVAALTMAGVLYEGSNRRAEAKARYEKALGINPRSAVAANNLAWMLAEDGENLDVALQHAQTAKAMLPKAPQVSDTLGWLYYKKGLYTAAISELQESVSGAPQVAEYHYRLGLAFAKVGETDKARESLTRALKLDGEFDGSEVARAALAGLP
jgi:tetratricopeptide (TPR) repeat protein